MSLTIQQLKKDYPQLYNDVHNLGIASERQRIKELGEIETEENKVIIREAILNGFSADAAALATVMSMKKKTLK